MRSTYCFYDHRVFQSAVLISLLLTLGHCRYRPPRTGPVPIEREEPSRPTTPAERRPLRPVSIETQIVTWLECEECVDGELQAVVALGEQAVPGLAKFVQAGPSFERIEAYREHLSRTYEELREYGTRHPEDQIQTTEQQYINMYSESLNNLYRIRAALGLSSIGGQAARNAIEEGLQQSPSEYVTLQLERILEEF